MPQIDRDAINEKYTVLTFIPQYEAQEELQWATNIFIASDLSETRRSLSQYPAISIRYSLNLQLDNRDFLFKVLSAEEIHNEWILPYFPHSTSASSSGGSLTIPSVDNITYPYHEYYLSYTRNKLVYKQVSDMSTEFSDEEEIWVAPCYRAFIIPQLTTVDLGKCRWGHEVVLSFRMAGDSEKVMTYHSDSFDFHDTVQIPVKTQQVRHQELFQYVPAMAHTNTPTAARQNQTPVVEAKYFLKYDDYYREDYPFRGVFMKGLGALTADSFVYEDLTHRLATDKLTIVYHQGYALATAMMRQVQE